MGLSGMFRICCLGASLLALAACSSSSGGGATTDNTLGLGQQAAEQDTPEQNTVDLRAFCPKAIVRAGTETFRTFDEGVQRSDPNAQQSVRFQATISESVRECNYSNNNLNIRVGIKGRIINGPSGATGTFTTPVRVAVASTTREVLYSQLHNVQVTIPEGRSNANFSFVDNNVNIPVPEKPNLVVYVGFDEGPPTATQ